MNGIIMNALVKDGITFLTIAKKTFWNFITGEKRALNDIEEVKLYNILQEIHSIKIISIGKRVKANGSYSLVAIQNVSITQLLKKFGTSEIDDYFDDIDWDVLFSEFYEYFILEEQISDEVINAVNTLEEPEIYDHEEPFEEYLDKELANEEIANESVEEFLDPIEPTTKTMDAPGPDFSEPEPTKSYSVPEPSNYNDDCGSSYDSGSSDCGSDD